VASVEEGRAPKPDGEDGLKALLLADAATQSARTGQAMRLAT
jgi:myo-inositol 2-dehydrogenase/D-chiro-inositol 1-dehydrogenase